MKTLGLLFLAVVLTACSTAYYNTMEKFGVHKREILMDRVVEARDTQEDAQEQFKSALEQFKSVVKVDGGELEKVYQRLNSEYEKSDAAANEIRDQIAGIESVADALFDEWEDELKEYSDRSLRNDSEQKLKATRAKYSQLVKAMKQAEDRLTPVLSTMYDQVLYLKHNLNARAVRALQDEVIAIDRDVQVLLQAMSESIEQADVFIREMKEQS